MNNTTILNEYYAIINTEKSWQTKTGERYPELSFNEIRGAWFAHDEFEDMVKELSEAIYRDYNTAQKRASKMGSEYDAVELARVFSEVTTHNARINLGHYKD